MKIEFFSEIHSDLPTKTIIHSFVTPPDKFSEIKCNIQKIKISKMTKKMHILEVNDQTQTWKIS
ncbi:hypothetical protein LF95_12430 [Thalassospira sp. TSL5-1]|nr:hypothetical protein LF95_12430 [Thalassospira sp. TSL5-1]